MKEIKLSRGLVALVDDEDFERINQHRWYANKIGRNVYAVRNIKRPDGTKTSEYMHAAIIGQKGIDHRNGDGLDNQRGNLRCATNAQNLQGFQRKKEGATSLFRGVSWHSQIGKWRAYIKVSGKYLHLGIFVDESDAARSYDRAAKENFGEFAFPNFTHE